MKSPIRRIGTLLLAVFLVGCAPELRAASVPQAWIDAPLDGMVLPLAPYEIVAHAADPTGVSEIEFNVDGTVIGSVAAAGPLFTARQSWSPDAPGEYVIQARGANGGGSWSEYAEVRVVVQGEAAVSPVPTVAGQTPVPTPSSNPNAVPTPSTPDFTLIQNANCRRGPSQVYEVLTSLLKDQVVPIVGRNEDGTWWLVRLPTGELCWFSNVTGKTGGNANGAPVATAPAPPQPPEQGCYVFDANQNPICTLPCPANAVPGGECTP